MRIFFLLATSWAFLQAQTPAVKQVQFEGSPAIALSNDKLELTVTLLGGSFARLILRDDPSALNPLWEPVRMTRELGQTSQFRGGTGHFVCVDGFGPVSREEELAGLPGHGEAHLQKYNLKGPATLEAELPIVHEKLTRALRMVDGENVAYVSSRLENLLGFDRPVNWAEHATIGSPFLQSGATVVDVSGSRSLTRPYERADQDQRLTSGQEFVWPMAPGLQGNVDLRRTPSQPHFIDHAATLVDPERKYGWVTALNTEKHLLIGWMFRRAEYPWVQYWGHYPASLKFARGLEFGTQPFDVPRRETIDTHSMFDVPIYRWLPAKSVITTDFLIFYTRTPAEMKKIDDVRMEGGRLVIEDRDARVSFTLAASLGL